MTRLDCWKENTGHTQGTPPGPPRFAKLPSAHRDVLKHTGSQHQLSGHSVLVGLEQTPSTTLPLVKQAVWRGLGHLFVHMSYLHSKIVNPRSQKRDGACLLCSSLYAPQHPENWYLFTASNMPCSGCYLRVRYPPWARQAPCKGRRASTYG